jgi:CcmD family protein
MQNWQIAIIPPLLVWFGLFLYLLRTSRRLEALEKRAEQLNARVQRVDI